MENLPIEIKSIILSLLNLKSQINFIFSSKANLDLTKYWNVKDKIFIYDELIKLSYYDCFENIKINDFLCVYPKKLRYLTFGSDFNKSIKDSIRSDAPCVCQNSVFCKNRICQIPLSVTHLTFGFSFNQSIKDSIRSETRLPVFVIILFFVKTGFAKNQCQ